MRRIVSAVASALCRPTVSVKANTCRFRLEISNVSMSATISRPTPARASAISAAPPMPPVPQTNTQAPRSVSCSAASTKPMLRVVNSA